MKELNSVYNPQRDIYNKQINALPGQQEAQMKGLQSAKEDAFNQIVTGANRRGVAFGGIPLEEQQSYLGSSYLPAVANLKNRFIQQKGSLQEALAELAGRQRAEARDIYDREYARELEQQRLEEARRAAARASSGGGGGGVFNLGGDWSGTSETPAIQQPEYQSMQKSNGSFAFTDPNGNPISAATYAKATGINFIDLVQQMARAGDKGASQIQGLIGNDFGYDPSKIAGKENIYNAFIWGTPYQQAKRYTGSGVKKYNSFPVSSPTTTNRFKAFGG